VSIVSTSAVQRLIVSPERVRIMVMEGQALQVGIQAHAKVLQGALGGHGR